MAYSPQDVYAKHLVSGRGYPLWTPEPDLSLPDVYIQEGLKIGDVGVVVPEDGSFDVFFNVCLPDDHILHRETGVPNNFTRIELQERDISKIPAAEDVGAVISTSSVTCTKRTEAPAEDSTTRQVRPGPLDYEFVFSREGAILILPEGAERYQLRNERIFRDAAIQHAIDWYTFAEERLGRIISHDSLYLITGFCKARSWSLAACRHGPSTGTRGASAQFKAVQVGGGNITTSYTWETRQAMDRRVGPSDHYYRFGIPNQAVFIRGFKIAVRKGILGRSKKITVKAGFPSVRSQHAGYSSSHWFPNTPAEPSGSSGGLAAHAPNGTATTLDTNTIGGDISADESGLSDNDIEEVTIHRSPQVAKPFHPSDIINQHLLQSFPSATVAITHDSQWTTLLEEGGLNLEELSQEGRLIASVFNNHSAVISKDVVYLQSTMTRDDVDGSAMETPVHPILGTNFDFNAYRPASFNTESLTEGGSTSALEDSRSLYETERIARYLPSPFGFGWRSCDLPYALSPMHHLSDPIPLWCPLNISEPSHELERLPSLGQLEPGDPIFLASAVYSLPSQEAPVTQSHSEPRSLPRGLATNARKFTCQWGICGTRIAFNRGSIASHLRKEHSVTCNGEVVECAWEGCAKRMQGRNLPRHIMTCHLGVGRSYRSKADASTKRRVSSRHSQAGEAEGSA